MLASAFGKASDHVKKTCEKACCDKVVIWVYCTKDFENVVKNSENPLQRLLCDNTERGKKTVQAPFGGMSCKKRTCWSLLELCLDGTIIQRRLQHVRNGIVSEDGFEGI